jgi:hypothetical protein
MKPYGLTKKILHNHPDVHPPKGWVNWWESETRDCLRKKAERQQAKKQILQDLAS